MLYREYKPSLILAPFVVRYWFVETTADLDKELCLPDGQIKMYISLGEKRPIYRDLEGREINWKDGVGGHPSEQSCYVELPKGLNFMGVTLTPSFFHSITSIPITELNDSVTDFEAVWGKKGGDLRSRIFSCVSDEERIAVMNAFFEKAHSKLCTSSCFIRFSEDMISKCRGNISIKNLLEFGNVSERTFERKFRTAVGMTPKYFARVLRFNKVCQLKDSNPHLTWHDIIYECGYYDQNHFIKDFKSFTGKAPTSFFEKEEQIRKVHIGKE